MKKILITGSAGFVGSSLISYFNENTKDFKIVGIDDLSYGYRERLEDLDLDFKKISVEKYCSERNLSNDKFDAVIHCAAIAPLPDNEADPVKSYEQNVVNTIRVAKYCTEIGCKKLIFLSTAALYELDEIYPSTEKIHHLTRFVYPTTKMCAEHALRAYANSYALNCTALRLFNLYGPRQDYYRKHPPLIGYLLKSLIKDETAYLYSDGEQKRDYIFINDLAKLIFSLIEPSQEKPFEVLNVGSGISYSVNQIVELIEKISGKKIKVSRLNSNSFWDKYPSIFEKKLPLSKELISKEVNKHSHGDIKYLLKKLNVSNLTSMKNGLSDCYNYAIKKIDS